MGHTKVQDKVSREKWDTERYTTRYRLKSETQQGTYDNLLVKKWDKPAQIGKLVKIEIQGCHITWKVLARVYWHAALLLHSVS